MLELGPCPAEDALSWSKFARRIVVELRSSPTGHPFVSAEALQLWSRTLEEWYGIADRTDGVPFRWVRDVEPEVAEFLLDGLDRCLHADMVLGLCTTEEMKAQRPFTALVIRTFVDGLAAEGDGCRHYAEQVLTSLGGLLDD